MGNGLLTFVDKISSLSDLKTIVKRHNEGNSWNAHQERMRETSYIARKFAELDEDASLKKLFIHLGTKTDLSYSPKLNGISLLALQMFLIWNNPGERPSIQGKTSPVLDSIVLTESLDWTMKRVKKFISLFHTFADELNNHYIKKAKDKNNKEVLPIAGLKFQISLLRNYIMFRLLINGNIETYSKDEYTVNDIKSLVQYYLHSEAHRRNDRQQYNTMGKKKYDKLIEKSKKGKLGGDKLKKEISSLKKYIPDMSYNRSLASASSPAYLANVLVEIQNDFISKLDGKLKGVVIKKGEKVDPFMKRIIREQAVLNSDGSIEEMSDKSNPIKYDIGHLEIPRAKGGEPTLKNLGLQDRSENRRQQDKH